MNRKALKWIISIQHQDFYHLIDVTNHNLTENAPIVTVLFLRGSKRFPIKTSYIEQHCHLLLLILAYAIQWYLPLPEANDFRTERYTSIMALLYQMYQKL